MAMAKKSVDFTFKSTSVTYAEFPGGGVNHINLEGTATGFGTVLGTLSLFAESHGAKAGRTKWRGEAYLDSGEQIQSTSEGFWEESGKQKWRVRGTLCNSLGDVYQTDGEISLDGRTYKGTLTESA
jgi:hypothetical protein